jgi:hypothetical protein
MAYLKGVFAGISFALVAAALWLVVNLIPLFRLQDFSGQSGSAGIGAVSISSGPLLAVAVVAFACGFLWTVRRSRAASR